MAVPVQRTISKWVSARIASASTLDPFLYLSPAAVLASVSQSRVTLGEAVRQIAEGARFAPSLGSAGAEKVLYRQANVSALRWKLSGAHWQQPMFADPSCVRPGDIVVNKLAPIRAAVATSRLHRHPVDSSCYLLRGLEKGLGLWAALCLNHPLYAEYLVRLAGASILPRVTMRALRELPLLHAPLEIRGLAEKTWALLDDFLQEEEALRRLVKEIQDQAFPDETVRFWEKELESLEKLTWWRRIPAETVEDSLLPGHCLFEVLRQQLQSELGWVPVERCLAPEKEQPPRTRLSVTSGSTELPRLRCLRISDVADDFTVAEAPHPEEVAWPGRVYEAPLQEDEVLLSLLVSNPTVAYAGVLPGNDILVTDHWERLVFRETPGAWAIILGSPLVSVQLRMLAQGSARQFLGTGTATNVLVPDAPRELRSAWHSSLKKRQWKRIELESDWRDLWTEAATIFDQSHRKAGIPISYWAVGEEGGVPQ